MHVHAPAYVRIIYEKAKGKFPQEQSVVGIGKTKHKSEKSQLYPLVFAHG